MDSMPQLLRSALGRSLRALADEDRLAAAWPVACGTAMARRGEIAGFSDGIVTILVADDLWLRQMMAQRAQLQHALARISGVPLDGVHFEIRRVR
jgi:predicted nucleic acid-binding Zn ribbon protein